MSIHKSEIIHDTENIRIEDSDDASITDSRYVSSENERYAIQHLKMVIPDVWVCRSGLDSACTTIQEV